jgi:hypothetical protein
MSTAVSHIVTSTLTYYSGLLLAPERGQEGRKGQRAGDQDWSVQKPVSQGCFRVKKKALSLTKTPDRYVGSIVLLLVGDWPTGSLAVSTLLTKHVLSCVSLHRQSRLRLPLPRRPVSCKSHTQICQKIHLRFPLHRDASTERTHR